MPTYNDTGLTPDTQYNYRVRAVNAVGAGPYSNEAHATTTIVPTPPTPPPSGATFPVTFISWDGTTASKRYSVGIPMKPGMLTAATLGRFRLYLGGVEQAIAVTALRGIPFEDGSLRAIGVQCIHTGASGVGEAGYFTIDAAGRGTTDIAWVEPTYASMQQRAVILPTDPAYLCATFAACVPLQPESADSTLSASMYGTAPSQELGEWAYTLQGSFLGQSFATGATYEHVNGLQCAWFRSGNPQYYQWAYDRLLDQMKGTVPGFANYYLPGSSDGAYAKVTAHDAGLAAGVSAGNSGLASEWNCNVSMGWVTGYWLTAWRQPWRKIAHMSNWAQTTTTTYAGARARWMGSPYGIRFNTQWFAFWMLAAYMVEATMQISAGYGAGRDPSRPWVTEVPWLVDAWYDDRYQTGTYTDGLTGQKSTAYLDCNHSVKGPGITDGHFPLFQSFIFAKCAIFYYENFPTDSRIPTFLQTFADFIIAQTTITGGLMYQPYEHAASPVPDPNEYFTNFYAQLFGFVYAATGNPTYKTWCGYAMNRAGANQFTGVFRTMKAWGEFMGGSQQAAAYYYDGGALRATPGAHRTTLIEPTAYTS